MAIRLVEEQSIRLNREALDEFIEHRKELKKPMTPLAIKKATNILMRHDLEHQQHMVDRAIMGGWTGIWEVERQQQQTTRQNTLQQDLEDTSWA